MCGIFCMITLKPAEYDYLVDALRLLIARRGPDFLGNKTWCTKHGIHLHFMSSILWTQGERLITQPCENEKSMFVYNGDIHEGIPKKQMLKHGDTELLLKLLENTNNVSKVLCNIQGPHCFVYLNKLENVLYFARDRFGRISLLIGRNNEAIVLTSVAKKGLPLNFIELPSIGIFSWNLTTDKLTLFPFGYETSEFSKKLLELEHFLGKSIVINKESMKLNLIIDYNEPEPWQIDFIKKLNIEEAFHFLLNDPVWMKNLFHLENLLNESLNKRINTQPKHCRDCLKHKSLCNHSLLGILFSGGVDCAVLAVLTDRILAKDHPIDLMNVAFNENNNFETPDRQTGISTLEELKRICPDRDWRFLEINICQKELNENRTKHIRDLIFPLQTVLDDSLGCALWFAGRGSTENYLSPCRIVLAGMGADELFGGYTKHRAAFKRGSWLGLHQALEDDWQNLPYRNHARDNRVVCDHGRELRTPYLDEELVEFVRNLPCWEKTCPTNDLPQGFGEKLLLRTLAYKLGLKSACLYKKRALQFGSRIANKKEKAHEISERLL